MRPQQRARIALQSPAPQPQPQLRGAGVVDELGALRQREAAVTALERELSERGSIEIDRIEATKREADAAAVQAADRLAAVQQREADVRRLQAGVERAAAEQAELLRRERASLAAEQERRDAATRELERHAQQLLAKQSHLRSWEQRLIAAGEAAGARVRGRSERMRQSMHSRRVQTDEVQRSVPQAAATDADTIREAEERVREREEAVAGRERAADVAEGTLRGLEDAVRAKADELARLQAGVDARRAQSDGAERSAGPILDSTDTAEASSVSAIVCDGCCEASRAAEERLRNVQADAAAKEEDARRAAEVLQDRVAELTERAADAERQLRASEQRAAGSADELRELEQRMKRLLAERSATELHTQDALQRVQRRHTELQEREAAVMRENKRLQEGRERLQQQYQELKRSREAAFAAAEPYMKAQTEQTHERMELRRTAAALRAQRRLLEQRARALAERARGMSAILVAAGFEKESQQLTRASVLPDAVLDKLSTSELNLLAPSDGSESQGSPEPAHARFGADGSSDSDQCSDSIREHVRRFEEEGAVRLQRLVERYSRRPGPASPYREDSTASSSATLSDDEAAAALGPRRGAAQHR